MIDFAKSVVAVPACNEAERIGPCLEALDAQVGARLSDIVVLVNNSDDDTAAIARSAVMHASTRLHVIECVLPPAQANAGHARRLAMAAAARLAGRGGILLTTDADGLVDDDWLAQTIVAMRNGADVVAGWVDLHPVEWGQIPLRLHEDDAQECAYDALCDEIHARLDPDPADPMPRHTQHSGASIAVTAEYYARCGGVPAVATGEDRALVVALRRIDARIRHAPEVHVTVSGRIEGRSAGGMADTIRRRLSQPDRYIDDRLEPALDCARRAACRAQLRQLYDDRSRPGTPLAARLDLSHGTLAGLSTAPYFGMAWAAVEAAAPALRRQRVPVAELAAQMNEAAAIVRTLRGTDDRGGRSDRPALVPEGLE